MLFVKYFPYALLPVVAYFSPGLVSVYAAIIATYSGYLLWQDTYNNSKYTAVLKEIQELKDTTSNIYKYDDRFKEIEAKLDKVVLANGFSRK